MNRNAAVGADGEVLGALLVTALQVEHLKPVRQPQLFERNRDLVPVGRGSGVER
jgi:hypothetical protein